jgi:hypothetical protein
MGSTFFSRRYLATQSAHHHKPSFVDELKATQRGAYRI